MGQVTLTIHQAPTLVSPKWSIPMPSPMFQLFLYVQFKLRSSRSHYLYHSSLASMLFTIVAAFSYTFRVKFVGGLPLGRASRLDNFQWVVSIVSSSRWVALNSQTQNDPPSIRRVWDVGYPWPFFTLLFLLYGREKIFKRIETQQKSTRKSDGCNNKNKTREF